MENNTIKVDIKMNIAIFDDNEWICHSTFEIIQKTISRFSANIQCNIQCFSDGAVFEAWVDTNRADVVILDISVPGNNDFGIECAKRIRKQFKDAHIIFLTSNDEKIHEVFSGLIRPTQFILKEHYESELEIVFEEILNEDCGQEAVIKVSYGRNEYLLNTLDIISIQKDGRKTAITLLERKIEVTDSLSSIFKRLGNGFLWVDKGSIVNIHMIKEVNYPEKRLLMATGVNVYMSRNSVKAVKNALDNMAKGGGADALVVG